MNAPTRTPRHVIDMSKEVVIVSEDVSALEVWRAAKSDAGNAAHIVRCVNAHAGLVAALNHATQWARGYGDVPGNQQCVWRVEAERALEAARL